MIQERTVSGQIREIVTENGRELLRESTLPENLWTEAIRYATYLKNRLPTKALKARKTPWEALYTIQPNISRERI